MAAGGGGDQQCLQLVTLATQATTTQQQTVVYQMKNALFQNAKTGNFLASVFGESKHQPMIRYQAGLLLKEFVRLKTQLLQNDRQSLAHIFQTALKTLQDNQKQIRSAAGIVIATLLSKSGIDKWPDSIGNIVKLCEVNNVNARWGALDCLRMVIEDCGPSIAQTNPQNMHQTVSTLIQFMKHPKSELRVLALECLAHLIEYQAPPFNEQFNVYFPLLAELMLKDSDIKVQSKVCRHAVLLLMYHYDQIKGNLAALINCMIKCTRLKNEPDIAGEAADFWATLCGDQTKLDDAAKGTLWSVIPTLIPILLDNCIYTESQIAMMQQDDEEEDSNEMKNANLQFRSRHAEKDEEGTSEWNVRKCSARSLDCLSHVFGEEQKFMEITLGNIQKAFNNPQWFVKEAGVLAVGAIAWGCWNLMQAQLDQLLPYLIQMMSHEHPFVRSITCWTIARFADGLTDYRLDGQQKQQRSIAYVKVMQLTIQALVDRSRRVQAAALSGFSMLVESAGRHERLELLNQPMPKIIEAFIHILGTCRAKNLPGAADALCTMADALGEEHMPAVFTPLMQPMMRRLQTIRDDDTRIFPFGEMITCFAINMGEKFAQCSQVVWVRAMRVLKLILQMQVHADAAMKRGEEYEEPNKEFLTCWFDCMSGIIEGLGAQSAALVGSCVQELIPILYQCSKDQGNSEVRRSAQVLVGDIVCHCQGHIAPHLAQFVEASASNLDPKHPAACCNGAWAIGEMTRRFKGQLAPLLQQGQVVERIGFVLNYNGSSNQRMFQNCAISLAIIAKEIPQLVATVLLKQNFVQRWCGTLAWYREDEHKVEAATSVLKLAQGAPQLFSNVQILQALLVFLTSFKEPGQFKLMAHQVLAGFKAKIGEQMWNQTTSQTPPWAQEKLRTVYNL